MSVVLSASAVYVKQCDLEARYAKVNPTLAQQRAALLVESTAGAKEGPCARMKAATAQRD
eukprot:gene1071-1362_t